MIEGIAKVELNKKEFILKQNQSTFVPLGIKHRLSNPSNKKFFTRNPNWILFR